MQHTRRTALSLLAAAALALGTGLPATASLSAVCVELVRTTNWVRPE